MLIKRITRMILKGLVHWSSWGWAGIVALYKPIYWTQDTQFKNNGMDLASVSKPEHYYFRGTYWQRNKMLDKEYNAYRSACLYRSAWPSQES
jgi:hypothetical protein